MHTVATRRRMLLIGSSAALAATALRPTLTDASDPAARAMPGETADVSAVEDLMREHGVLRRALVVYDECVPRLLHDPASVDADALSRTAKLFRTFGEAYHERELEEAHIFPRLQKAGRLETDVRVLRDQHDRGREITEYVTRVTAGARISAADAQPLANALRAFVRMYMTHAAREDTVVFPAWKALLSPQELNEMAERFEGVERAQFGGDGFDLAVRQIADVERALALADLSRFTAPPPPH